MKISVWDTYVKKEDGTIMHFDILVPDSLTDEQVIFKYGTHYLESKPFKVKELTVNECRFCHIEQATDEIIAAVTEKGYAIIEMENCS
ncbi:DUF2024 family protein [Flavivirga amylovorans]|uniref:DUF2024 family protein n=1 Tax=Flavivirga amylovorans TaxID=870486 RepID=A0ABT8WYC4_9FLAO|nr:DUF2024 family protein [Flavivirga amylovorans]MDO5986468.1 DUF2024 family protein [Flavivirga amylovorans]